MPVSALSSSEPTSAAALSSGATSAANEQRFLKLLVTQLNNQDPLNPMDNAQLTSQLAQMSTVSGIEKMNETLRSMLAQSGAAQMLQAAGMVGRSVLSQGSLLSNADGASFAVDLPSSAESVRAVITDGAGNALRSVDLGGLPAGLHAQAWDGKDGAGKALPAGTYRVQVVAANGSANVPAATLVYDRVASVAQSAGAVLLDLSAGRSIALADVREVR